MKSLINFSPLIVFFIAYKMKDIYFATAALMIATIIQSIVLYFIDKYLHTMQKVTLVLILIFGTLTITFHNDAFVKWKSTLLYLLMALALAFYAYILKNDPLKKLAGDHLSLPDPVWARLTSAWIVYSIFMSLLNSYIVLYFTTEIWMNFELWGYVFPFAFLAGQALFISPYIRNQTESV